MGGKLRRMKTEPKDIFLQILATLTLYVSAGSFIALWFQYINLLVPDLLEARHYYMFEGAYRMIRWSIAALIVIFPVFLGTSWFLEKQYRQEPEKRKLGIRKWLVYFTLFAAALILIGDLVALIFNLLGGELTLRFLLKVLTFFFVAGSVFYYYLWDLKKHRTG